MTEAGTTLTERQREILRRVVEEYVSRGSPWARRPSRHRRARRRSVDGAERARRARELRAAHASAHVRGPGADRARLPFLRGRAARAAGAAAVAVSARPDRGAERDRGCAPGDDGDALAGHASARARLGADSEAATIRHVEVLRLQPQVVMVVVITSAGAVTKRVFAFGNRRSIPASRAGRAST